MDAPTRPPRGRLGGNRPVPAFVVVPAGPAESVDLVDETMKADIADKLAVALDADEVREGGKAEPFAVRETGRLFRLRSERCLAVVAADTEDEARALAASYDLQGGDWRSPAFASAEFEETGEAHVFGDVVISALPPRQA
jgi:hypothetical protein